MEEESLNKVRLQEEEIHRRNMERVNQIRMIHEVGNRTYIQPSEQMVGVSRGFYEAGLIPERGVHGVGTKLY